MAGNINHVEVKHPRVLEPVPKTASQTTRDWNIDSLLDIELPISILFGSLDMPLVEISKLGAGSVVELDKSVNDPVTVIVNHTPIAKGEMVAIGDNYGIRILEVRSTADRIRSLR